MQTIYALRTSSNPVLQKGDADRLLKKHFDLTLSLYTFQLWFLSEVALYAETDARQKAAKHIPSALDLSVPTKIARNELVHRILNSEFFAESSAIYKPHLSKEGQEWIRKVYLQLAESTQYAVYNSEPGHEKKRDKEILEYIYTDLMLANEDFVDYVEDMYNNWDDDADMLRLLLLQFLQKPGVFRLDEMIGKEKFQFAKELLETTEGKKEYLGELIKPRLRNWDAERLAQLDMILLELGAAEFLYFETIPPKVTINEYIDIAKEYSTEQSGHFINGILDNLKKELEGQDLMTKVAYKKG